MLAAKQLAPRTSSPAETTVNWVREHYHARAVETPAQRRWILTAAGGAFGMWDNAYRQRDNDFPLELREALDTDPEIAEAFAAQSAQNRFSMAFRVADLKRPSSRAARLPSTSRCSNEAKPFH